MVDEHGKAYVIEVNGNPRTGIIKITGHNHFTDFVEFTEKKVDKKNKDSAKEESTPQAQLLKAQSEIRELKLQLAEEQDQTARFKYAYNLLKS